MKKRLALPMALALCAALSVPIICGAALSSQITGFQKLTLVPGRNFIGLNFKNPHGGGFDIQKLFDSGPLAGGISPETSDQLILWDAGSQSHVELWLFDSGGEDPARDGKWIELETDEVSSRTLFPAGGFWLLHTGSEVVEVILSGDVEPAATVVHAARDGYNLFASAWPVDKAVSSIQVDGFTGGATRPEADRIVLWNPASQTFTELWLFDSGGIHADFDGKWIDRTTGDVVGDDDRIIPAGTAVWAIKRTAGDLVETKPF